LCRGSLGVGGSKRRSLFSLTSILSSLASLILHFAQSLLRENFALVDPNLHANRSVDGVRSGLAIVDVSSNRVQRDLSDLIAFSSSDFRTTESSGHLNLDTAAVHSGDAGHRLAHGSAVTDSLLKLSRDVLGNQLSIKFGLSNFRNVHLNHHRGIGASNLSVQRVRELIDTLSAAANDGTRSGGKDCDLDAVCRSLNLYS
jgi:hypothetical protein